MLTRHQNLAITAEQRLAFVTATGLMLAWGIGDGWSLRPLAAQRRYGAFVKRSMSEPIRTSKRIVDTAPTTVSNEERSAISRGVPRRRAGERGRASPNQHSGGVGRECRWACEADRAGSLRASTVLTAPDRDPGCLRASLPSSAEPATDTRPSNAA
jgi:hypothetical protein